MKTALMLLKINLKKKIKKYYKMALSQVVILMSLLRTTKSTSQQYAKCWQYRNDYAR